MRKKILIAVLIFIFVIGLVSMVRLSQNSSTDIAVTSSELKDSSANSEIELNENKSETLLKEKSSALPVSLKVLSIHNTEKNCWVAYKSKVYDITSFLLRHPGGMDKILPHCGSAESFENAFTKKHGTSKVDMLMKVGVFIGDFDLVGKVEE